MPGKLNLPLDPHESARAARLRYVTPGGPGIVRKRSGKSFSYIGVNGKPLTGKEDLARIRSLAIPPAWTNVWICPSRNGHLQATGRDALGRKQYRYHPQYREIRDQTKFNRMRAFAAALPGIRRRVRRDLKLPGTPRAKVLATVVSLLENTCIRVGNEEYAKANDSYGLTTMKDNHVEISGRKLRFRFRGKSGIRHKIELNDPKLARIVRECQCIPGEELFQYIDEAGHRRRVRSEDVNDYLREITRESFTAKDFRTWVGSCQMALELERLGMAESEVEAKNGIVKAIKEVAQRLGNRPATCRKYYVHPVLMDTYTDGTLLDALQKTAGASRRALRREELCLISLLGAPRLAKAA